MDALRNAKLKFDALTTSGPNGSSTPGAKLSKAFRFNKDKGIMKHSETGMSGFSKMSRNSGDPFKDGPTLEEPSLPRIHLILHCVAVFFNFLGIATIAAVAGFQAKWFAVSGGTGFTLFLLLVVFITSMFLIIVPLSYDRWDKFRRPAKFLHNPRSTLILHGFGAALMILVAFIVTISVWTAKGCKDANLDPHSKLGDDYKNGLGQWCTTKKASAIFDWLAFGAWAALLVIAGLRFRRERNNEPGFIPPSDVGISAANVHEHVPMRSSEDEDPYADKEEDDHRNNNDHARGGGYESYGYGQTRVAPRPEENGAFGRPSMDAYGAFDGDMPAARMPQVSQGDERSRTMQLAYNDPYANIRQSLMSPPAGGYAQQQKHQPPQLQPTPSGYPQYQPVQPVQQAQQVIPQPPQYGGMYR